MIRCFCCLVLLNLALSVPATAGDPWFEPPRYGTLNDEQKKWLEERAAIHKRIEALQNANWASPQALNLVRSCFDRDRKVFGDNHEEIAKSIHYMFDRFYFAGEFATAVKIETNTVKLYEQLFGRNNWRARSVALHLDVIAELSQQGRKPLRTLYGDAWRAFDAAENFFRAGQYAEAMAKYEQAARLLSRVGKAIGVPDSRNLDLAKTVLYVGDCQRALAAYDKAEAAVRATLAILKKSYGDDHPNYAEALVSLGMIHRDLDQLPQAELAYREALACLEKAFKYPHRQQVEVITHLGDMYADQKKLGLAEEQYRRALRLVKDADSPWKNARLKIEIGLANVCERTKRLEEAETHAREALKQARDNYKEQSQDFVNACQKLSQVLKSRNKYAEALEISEKALARQLEVTGGRHPYAAIVGTTTGMLRRLNGNRADAEELLQNCLANHLRNYGERHNTTRITLDELGALLAEVRDQSVKDGKLETARDAQKRLVEACAKLDANDAWPLVAARLRLAYFEDLLKTSAAERKPLVEAMQLAIDAEAFIKDEKWQEALPPAEKAAAGRAKLAAGALVVAEDQARLGDIYYQLSNAGKAEAAYQAALPLYAKLFPVPPPVVAGAYLRLGEYARRRGEFVAALAHIDYARDLYRHLFGKRTAEFLDASRAAIRVRLDLGRLRPLEADARELVDLFIKVHGVDSPLTQAAQGDLAAILLRTNQLAPAEKILLDLIAKSAAVKDQPGRDHIAYQHRLGLLRRQAGKYEEAASLLEQSLNSYGEHVSTSDAVYAQYLAGFATIQWELGKIDLAETLLRRAIALHEKHGKTNEKLPARLVALLETRRDRQSADGKLDDAKKTSDEVIAVLKKQFGDKHSRVQVAEVRRTNFENWLKFPAEKRKQALQAATAGRAIQTDLAQGRYGEALKKAEDAIKIGRAMLGPDHFDLASLLLLQADAQTGLGQCAEARKSLEQAKAIRTKALRADHPDVAAVHAASGRLAYDAGELSAAIEAFRQAVTIYGKQPGPASPECGVVQAWLGLALLSRGECAPARASIQAGIDILYPLQAEHPAAYMQALLAHADWLLATGDVPQAIDDVDRAFATGAARNAGDGPLVARAFLARLKIAQIQRNEYTNVGVVRKWVPVIAQTAGQSSLLHAEALLRLSAIEGKGPEGDKALQQAQRLRAAALGGSQGSDALAAGRNGLAKGDLADAERLFRAALAGFEKNGGDAAAALFGLADVLHRQGKIDEAEKLYTQHAERGRALLTALSTEQTDSPAMQLALQRRASLDRLLSLPANAARNDANYAQVLLWKGAASDRAGLLRTARARPELAGLFQQHDELAVRLATLATRVPYGEERAWWYARVEALTDEWERLETAILHRAKLEAPRRSTLAELRKALPPKTVLIDFVEYTHTTFTPFREERRLAAFDVRGGQPLRRIDLGPTYQIAHRQQNWRNATRAYMEWLAADEQKPLTANDRQKLEDAAKTYADAGDDLRRYLGTKLEDVFDGVETVYLSPDGQLAKFPFAALPIKNGAYPLEKCDLVVVPVPARLPRALAQHKPAAPTLLAMGGIDFNAAPEKIIEKLPVAQLDPDKMIAGAMIFNRPGVVRLPQTAPEVKAIAATFRQRFNDPAAVLRLEREATENQFREYAKRSSSLHLATHGFFDPRLLRQDFAARVPGSGIHVAGPRGLAIPRILYDPGVFSGITLAGANEANDPEEDDGILWSLEIASRDLRSVELAVLSACDTAEGVVVPGEGVLGLQRAFHVAGARNVISTLWPISDRVARQLMERFYQNVFDKKMGQAAALREAQLWVLNAGRLAAKSKEDPTYPGATASQALPELWAPFVLSIDGD